MFNEPDFDDLYGSKCFAAADPRGRTIRRKIGKVDLVEFEEKRRNQKGRYIAYFEGVEKGSSLTRPTRGSWREHSAKTDWRRRRRNPAPHHRHRCALSSDVRRSHCRRTTPAIFCRPGRLGAANRAGIIEATPPSQSTIIK
jgi:hypothetical protein